MLVVLLSAAVNAADNPSIPDSIDQLVSSLSATQGLWLNGRWVPIQSPVTTSPEQVVQNIFHKTGFYQSGKVTDYKIVTTRKVYINGGKYTAALVKSNLGKMIILFNAGGQWNRAFVAAGNADSSHTETL